MNSTNRQLSQRGNGVKTRYKCVFFDLDHTLWDYDCNARETLLELHTAYNLLEKGIAFEDFHQRFKIVNFELWQLYDKALITNDVIRNERFKQILEPFKVYEERLCTDLSQEYMTACPRKAALIPFAKEALEYLSARYSLTIVTNGFAEIQTVKLMSGNITHYFEHVITSENAGSKKPSRKIFEYALLANKLQCHEVVMIGDNLVTDIGGARNACIDTIFYNPEQMVHAEEVNHEIRCLSELQKIL